MNAGPTFDRVYLALKEQLMSARFEPGAHLEPAALGEEFCASITPVRDALHRLVGQGLVEAPRGEGFRVPAPTEAELRNLYGWHNQLLELALNRRSGRTVPPIVEDRSPGAEADIAAGELFRLVVRRSGNPEHERALAGIADRLAALRLSEVRIFDDWSEELDILVGAYQENDVVRLRRAIGAYHRRRQRSAPEILVAARSSFAKC